MPPGTGAETSDDAYIINSIAAGANHVSPNRRRPLGPGGDWRLTHARPPPLHTLVNRANCNGACSLPVDTGGGAPLAECLERRAAERSLLPGRLLPFERGCGKQAAHCAPQPRAKHRQAARSSRLLELEDRRGDGLPAGGVRSGLAAAAAHPTAGEGEPRLPRRVVGNTKCLEEARPAS